MGNAIAGIFIVALLAGTLTVFGSLGKGRIWGKDRRTAHEKIALKLDALINLPSSSPDLSATTGTPHSDGTFDWEVKDLSPRLKQISLRMNAPNSGKSIGQLGYRYDDY